MYAPTSNPTQPAASSYRCLAQNSESDQSLKQRALIISALATMALIGAFLISLGQNSMSQRELSRTNNSPIACILLNQEINHAIERGDLAADRVCGLPFHDAFGFWEKYPSR